jgi:hypothetical protein
MEKAAGFVNPPEIKSARSPSAGNEHYDKAGFTLRV